MNSSSFSAVKLVSASPQRTGTEGGKFTFESSLSLRVQRSGLPRNERTARQFCITRKDGNPIKEIALRFHSPQ